MSRLFYDHLITIEDVYLEIDELSFPEKTKHKLKDLIDETVSHRVLTLILDRLPSHHHEEFLEKLHQVPFDKKHLKYLDQRINTQISSEISKLGKKLKRELLVEIRKYAKRLKK